MLFKNTLKKIKKSFGRYLSLLVIILLGVAFYAGIKQAAPNMKDIQTEYYANTNLMDFKISSTLGLTEEDVNAIRELDGIENVVGSYSKNVLHGENAINVHAIEDNMNGFEILDGQMPQKNNECLADDEFYNVGDIIKVTEDDDENNLKIKEFTVTGTIRFPIYTGADYGNASIGNGKLTSFILIPKENFDYEVYTEIYITAEKNGKDIPYSEEYTEVIENVTNQINSIKEERENARYNSVFNEAQNELNEAKQEFEAQKEEAEEKFSDAEKQIADGKIELEKGQKELNSNKQTVNKKFKEAQEEIDNNKNLLLEQKQLLKENKVTAEQGFQEAENKKKELENNRIQVNQTLQEINAGISQIETQLQDTTLQEEQKVALETQKQTLIQTREQLNTNLTQIEVGITQIENEVEKGKKELEEAEKQINEGLLQIENAQKTLSIEKQKANKELEKAQDEINKGKQELEDAKRELEENRIKYEEEIKDAQIKIDDAQAEVNKIEEAKWYVQNRDDVVTSYEMLGNQYGIVDTIANVIPLFFILVVVLMTSNTMARMITEERGEMGTLSSLGISNKKIISNYMVYVLSSTILGTIFGYIIGIMFIPQLVYACFPLLMGDMGYRIDLIMMVLISAVSCLVMSLVTIFACSKELRQKPAYLLRPVAPKSGKKILLERMPVIWNNLSFSWKITMRNISRYKKRVFMTLVGTAGCTFLILIGFALRDSINGVGDKQYTQIFKYDNLMILDSTVESMTESLSTTLEGNVKNILLLNQSSYKAKGESDTSINTYIIVPEKGNEYFENYFILKDYYTGEELKLDEEGVIITPKIEKRLNKTVGDEIILENSDKDQYKVKVIGITDNNVSNYVYMTSDLYERTFGESIKYNCIVSENDNEEEQIANNLLDSGKVLSINFSRDLLEKANNSISGLNSIVILLVGISSLLAITVLYNLTSINISERTREIATLKVLGFKEVETNEYIYRETLITVIIGIIIGLLITPSIHGAVADLLDSDELVMLRQIKPISFIYSAVITLVFAIIMGFVTDLKLKGINMIESLKSVE